MKIKIVIANTLKPVDDVRAYEKIAKTIAKTNKYEVNIIGNEAKKESQFPNINFISHKLNRNSIARRLNIRLKVLARLIKLNPDILVVTTHELLLTAVFLKLTRDTKIIYDVQEDYRKNIRYLSQLLFPINLLMANLVRLKERFSSVFIDQFWLAEKCYSYEIGFPKKRTITLENYATTITNEKAKNDDNVLLFSGTISKYSGVVLAIEVFLKMVDIMPSVQLKIIGQCHDISLLKKLKEIENTNQKIKLNIATNPVPHEQIVNEILSATLGIISYQPNEVNRNKIPTKLYEYSLYKLPYIIQRDSYWEQTSKKLGRGIPIDFLNPDISFILEKLKAQEEISSTSHSIIPKWEDLESEIYTSLDSLNYLV
jgi:glycosyltransferase involved in cell wall biosynthesis